MGLLRNALHRGEGDGIGEPALAQRGAIDAYVRARTDLAKRVKVLFYDFLHVTGNEDTLVGPAHNGFINNYRYDKSCALARWDHGKRMACLAAVEVIKNARYAFQLIHSGNDRAVLVLEWESH